MFNLVIKKKVNLTVPLLRTVVLSGAHFNFSKYELSDCEKGLLAKGLNFSLPSKYLDYADYLVNFELFYRNSRNLGILSNEV